MRVSIEQARKLRGKTQAEMAKALDIHVQTYRTIEKEPEKATMQQLEIIATVTGADRNHFFYGQSPLSVD